MNELTRWYIKSALIFFVAALLIRLSQAVNGVLPWFPLASSLGPVYFHFFLVGWITQLIFGVVYWMFPKYSIEKPRGSEPLAWGIFWMLNTGLILRAVGEPLHSLNPSELSGGMLVGSAILQWLAGIGFIANTWPRVKER